ncbi:MAG: hypothetical protein JNM17_16670 [Archangium sp.]|nr:hypothetical protein [Archangium sp.]
MIDRMTMSREPHVVQCSRMKIGKPPSMAKSVVDIAKVPNPIGGPPIPAPVPNVSPASTFAPAPGAERRFSARFMNALPQKLQLANVPKDLGDKLQARFGSMNRSELDRFGRLAETLMGSAKPAEALGLFEAFSSLHTAILPGGHRVEPNAEGSWTVTPKGKDPFELPNTKGAQVKLEDETHLLIDTAGQLKAGKEVVLDRAVAEAAQRIQPERLMMAALAVGVGMAAAAAGPAVTVGGAVVGIGVATAGLGVGVAAGGAANTAVIAASIPAVAAAVVGLAVTVVQNTPQLMNGLAVLADSMGMAEEGKKLRGGSQTAETYLNQAPVRVALTTVMLGAAVLSSVGTVLLLDQAGRGAAPSPRADPDLERGLLLLKAAGQPPADELANFAKSIRGKARDELQKLLPR